MKVKLLRRMRKRFELIHTETGVRIIDHKMRNVRDCKTFQEAFGWMVMDFFGVDGWYRWANKEWYRRSELRYRMAVKKSL